MVKWKKMNKKMAGLLLGVMMLFTASTTAFAYVDESAEASKVETTQTEQSTDKEEKKDEATNTNEVLPEDGTDKGTAFTTPGNGEVKDDITDDSTKEFLTVTTKNNNTFYIVIDRSATSQNVYMLSQIDENDLSEFLDKDSTAAVVTPQPDKSKVVLDETNNEDVDKKATVDPEKTAVWQLTTTSRSINLKKRKMRMISRKVWKQVDWKKFRMRKSLKTKILKKMKNK